MQSVYEHAYERIWIEINSNALVHNIQELKRHLGSVLLAPVIKCNAYGHGLIEVAQVYDQLDEAYMLCVAFLSEALALRQSGISKPILVLACIDTPIDQAINGNISFVVDSKREIDLLYNVAQKYHTSFAVHLKIDTGFARRGISGDDINLFMQYLAERPHVQLKGVCTHLASAYNPDMVQTNEQLNRFNYALERIKKIVPLPPLVHIANSSLISTPATSLCRVGLALYGYNPSSSHALDLKPVLSLKTRIHTIRQVNAGIPIGYDGLSVTQRTTRVALIPVGYADGYDMRFSLCAVASVEDRLVAVLGRVGMNFFALDVTDVPKAVEGALVTLIGDKPGITMADQVHNAGLKNMREIFARLNPLIKRYVV